MMARVEGPSSQLCRCRLISCSGFFFGPCWRGVGLPAWLTYCYSPDWDGEASRHPEIGVLRLTPEAPVSSLVSMVAQCLHVKLMDTKEQLQKDAARARRLAESASDRIAQELIEIAEQLEMAAGRKPMKTAET
jgi:hypothetical protein